MIIAIYARKSTEQIVATCSRCNRSYAVEAGRVQESVKKHEEGCRIFLDLEDLTMPTRGYRALDRAHPLRSDQPVA
jgi:hypothetical protein